MRKRHLLWTLPGVAFLLLALIVHQDRRARTPGTTSAADRHTGGAASRAGSAPRPRVRTTRPKIAPTQRTRVRIAHRAGGWELAELLEVIRRQSGQVILHDAVLRRHPAKVEFIGALQIPRADLFDWLQAVLTYHGHNLVRLGSDEAGWFCVESR